mmetsp:Transcript_11341/g.11363  ORF Transcript_11341/g.11363 Transcript_11341/m.11363 type:complete len:257 (+) Transcript_11341:299-1069(+)
MDVVITELNLVYFLGGSLDANLDILTNQVFEWNLVTNKIKMKQNMIYKAIDFGSCYLNGVIYVVGGYTYRIFHTTKDSGQAYHIKDDNWVTLPTLKNEGPCTVIPFNNSSLMAFFEGKNVIQQLVFGDNSYWKLIILKDDCRFGLNQAVIQLNSEEIVVFGGFLNNNEGTTAEKEKNEKNLDYFKKINIPNRTCSYVKKNDDEFLQIEDNDFFYLNQIKAYKDEIYALGKDHIYIIDKKLKNIDKISNEGDHCSDY